ncbi:MAG: hypothetical protein IIV92_02330 [Schwartzia sp.]|nr:hypothetical protein [Schwartzia sp. (in: firmicutes)]
MAAKHVVSMTEGNITSQLLTVAWPLVICGTITVVIMYGFAPLGISWFIDSTAGDNVAMAAPFSIGLSCLPEGFTIHVASPLIAFCVET